MLFWFGVPILRFIQLTALLLQQRSISITKLNRSRVDGVYPLITLCIAMLVNAIDCCYRCHLKCHRFTAPFDARTVNWYFVCIKCVEPINIKSQIGNMNPEMKQQKFHSMLHSVHRLKYSQQRLCTLFGALRLEIGNRYANDIRYARIYNGTCHRSL